MSSSPKNSKEYFKIKHAYGRNIIEKCFGLLKLCWATLKSPSFYPIKTHGRIIISCYLLYNLVRREMLTDPIKRELDDKQGVESIVYNDTIGSIEVSIE